MPENTKKKKVAIVGFTPSRMQTPYDDDDFEVWGLNGLYKFPDIERATRWFDLHEFGKGGFDKRIEEHYAECGIPVYLQDVHPKVPTSVKFPKREIEKALGSRYFTNSISWMIALAIHEGFDVIHVYGVDMSTPDEFQHQRNNLEYWLGRATERCSEVYVPESSDLLMATHQYGYGSDNGVRLKLEEKLTDLQQRMQGIRQQIGGHQQEIQKLDKAFATLDGARQNVQWMLDSLTIPEAQSKYISDQGELTAEGMEAIGPLEEKPKIQAVK